MVLVVMGSVRRVVRVCGWVGRGSRRMWARAFIAVMLTWAVGRLEWRSVALSWTGLSNGMLTFPNVLSLRSINSNGLCSRWCLADRVLLLLLLLLLMCWGRGSAGTIWLVSGARRRVRVAVNIKFGVGHLVLLNGVHLQHQSVQMAGIMLALGADFHHLIVVSWGAAVLARVL